MFNFKTNHSNSIKLNKKQQQYDFYRITCYYFKIHQICLDEQTNKIYCQTIKKYYIFSYEYKLIKNVNKNLFLKYLPKLQLLQQKMSDYKVNILYFYFFHY